MLQYSYKSLKWSVEGNLPGMQESLYAVSLTDNPQRDYLFVSDGSNGNTGNSCIQMFSILDGQYLGCLIKEGEQGLGNPGTIAWHSASHSLAVAHIADLYWSLRMISIK